MSRRVGLLVGGGAVLAAAVAAYLLAGRGGPPTFDPSAGRATAEAFLADLRAGRADAAWAGTSTEFKSILGRDGLRALVRAKPALRGEAAFDACERADAGGLSLAVCTFRAARGETVRVTLAPDGAAWKVERLAVE